MGAQIKVEDTDIDEEIFDCTYHDLAELKAIFIRAAIAYLSNLSAKDLSKDLLVNEGILDAHTATQIDEVVTITNYRFRIDNALKLPFSWCREQTGDGKVDLELFSSRGVDLVPVPVPIADSILGPEAALIVGGLAGLNLPYHIDQIPKTLPPVLSELKLKGLHHFVAQGDDINYEQAQDIVAFLDKMKLYLKFGPKWSTEYGSVCEQLRTVFNGCKAGGKVTIQ